MRTARRCLDMGVTAQLRREGKFVCYQCEDDLHVGCVGVPCHCPCSAEIPSPIGVLHVEVYHRGRLLDQYAATNLIVNGWKSTGAQLLAGNAADRTVSQIGFGSSAVAPAVTDTSLTSEFRRGILSIDHPQPNQARVLWRLDASEANGLAIREFGLYTTDNTLIARKVRGASIAKTSDIHLEGTWTITF